MPCQSCRERGKDWDGADPRCAFEQGVFDEDNWNCATVNAVRALCYEGQHPMPDVVDYRYCQDQKYATIYIDHIDEVEGLALWVSWYKNRGATEAMWILDNDRPPRKPTEAECRAVVAACAAG